MTPLVPVALTGADLPIAELSVARLDGELFSLAGSWCPVDILDEPATRAAALAGLAGSSGPAGPAGPASDRLVAERMTAAWIYGLAPEPAQHQFCVDVTARTRKPDTPNALLREVRLRPGDIRVVGRMLVTVPRRTAVDLARWGSSPAVRADTELLAALLAYDVDARDAGDGLPAFRRGISFSRVAAAQLDRARLRMTG
ncbi:hypothetical protein [Cryobacterium arcticum]|uniref:AbiEi antitoxin C-terminal domain-containing protein n=1 Tax=Cryobacterium arcticum TaxID=670052 RepID=A0A1B1BJT3_9MICO|nr:hypothetical protein [Cryobacterium arcticum]ANP72828.1 hypothetical protein PA27867_1875 [Cryobacterium arcticum]